MAEKPTIEETATPEVQTPPAEVGGGDIQNLVQELEAVGARTPQDIRGMATASREAGNLARMLGEIRSENKELKRMLEDQTSRRTPAAPVDPYAEAPSSSGVNLDTVVEKAVWNVVNKIGTQQREAQTRFNAEIGWMKNHDDYPLVKAEIDAKLSDPVIQQAITNGDTTIRDVFHSEVSAKLKGFVLRSADVLKKMGRPAGDVEPQHTEGGQGRTPVRATTADEKNAKKKDILKNWTGTDDDIEKVLDIVLGAQK